MGHPERPADPRHARGNAGELHARQFLEAQGLQCIVAGWRCRLGELDLVMRDDASLVFVEVRARSGNSMIDALESIGPGKQQRFVRAARAWLSRHPAAADLPARFDIIAIDGADIRWLRDAFSVPAW